MPENPAGIQLPRERRRPEPEPLDLDILHEDDALLVLNKPPGLVVHPTYKNQSGTLLNGVLWHVRGRHGIQPSIITRLDKDTSGLVLVALTPEVHARAQRDGIAGRMTKEYLALVRGVPDPPAGAITLPLARSLEDRRRVVVTEAGQPCETRYRLVSKGPENDCSVLLCQLVTGRSHQIRVHLSEIGCPILGDRTYGAVDASMPRQALHAWRIRLPHPVTREPMEVSAPLPADLGIDDNSLEPHGRAR
jgi:23S rRNA pseudouridine1911/1915/1917 synthase